MDSGDNIIHNILTTEETKKFHRIKRTCIICGVVINNMTQHLQRKHGGLSNQEKIEYRAVMLRQTPIQRKGTARKNVKKPIKCPLCLMPVQRIENHLETVHKLKRGTANMKSLVAQAKDCGAVTATEPNLKDTAEIFFDVVKMEQDGQMTAEEQPNSRATKHAVFDIVKIETDDEKQDNQTDQTKETTGKTGGGIDKAVKGNQVGSKEEHRIKRTCIICGEIINHMALHLRRKHPDLSDQEKTEYRAEMRRQTPIRKSGIVRKKLRRSFECPLCRLPVQKVDGHLVNAHKLKRGTAKMKSLVSQARDRGPVTATEEPTSSDSQEIISDQVEEDTVEGKQDDQVDQTKESLRENTGGMDKAVKENEDTKPEKRPQSDHTSILLNTAVDKGSKKKHRIKRTCIICGEIINHMALHLRRKHCDLGDQEKIEYRAEMLRQAPIRKTGIVGKNEKRSFECPLCRLPVQRLDGHLVNAHKLERGTAKMKSLVSQAKGSRKEHRINRTCIICGEIINHMALHLRRKHCDLSDKEKMEYRAKMLQQRPISKRRAATRKNWKSCFECPLCGLPVQKVDGHLVNAHKLKRRTAVMTSLVSQAKERGPVTAAQQPKSKDTQENISDQVEQHTVEGKQDDQILMGQTKESLRRSTGGMDKAGEENQEKKLSPVKPQDGYPSFLLNTSSNKEGAKKCHRIKRTCIICGEIINHMALHLRNKHPDLSDQEKMEYRVKMLRQTPIHRRKAPRKNWKSCLECPLCGLPVQKVDGHLVNAHKLKRGTVVMTSLVSQAKDGAKKFHRIKRACIICRKVIKNMTQHLQSKHYGLSDQEKIEYRAEMLRQTPIHQRGTTRENVKRSFECSLCGLPVQRIDEHLIKKHKLIRGTAKLKSFVYQAKETHRSASRTSMNSDDDSRHVSIDVITEDNLHANPGLHATSHAVLEENSAILNNLSPGKRSCQKSMVRFPPREKLKHLCFVCGKLFNGKSNLASHMTVHSGKRSHHCSVCDKSFTNRYNLEKHARIHSGEKPYRCDECDGKFSTSSRLASHKMYHTGKKPHRCLLCDKAFSKQQDLKGHMEVHTGLKKFECVVCDKAFAKEGFLKVHMRIHADNKSYQCSVCKKAFTTKRYLEGHMVIHSG